MSFALSLIFSHEFMVLIGSNAVWYRGMAICNLLGLLGKRGHSNGALDLLHAGFSEFWPLSLSVHDEILVEKAIDTISSS